MNRQVELLKVYFPIKAAFPNPADIQNTGQWYLLDHVSSSLAYYDHIEGKFKPQLAHIESYSGGSHTFTLLDDARFSDGTKITADDVIASIKRLVVLKTSTHFPLWQYLEGCENLKSMNDQCSGLKKISENKIQISLKEQVEDFQLQMASPETGIWKASDIDLGSKNLEIKPTVFSGPYSIEKIDASGFLLQRNPYNPISKRFLDSPLKIQIKTIPSSQVFSEMKSGQLDIMIRSRNPMDQSDYAGLGFNVFSSSPSTLIYLHGAGKEKRQMISRQLIQSLWTQNSDQMIQSADNFLPFDPAHSISQKEFLESLPESGAKKLKIGVPWTYLTSAFYSFIQETGQKNQISIELVSLTPDEWNECFNTDKCSHDIDYVLGVYAASERYPAVQLRYIAGNVRTPEISLNGADTPELSEAKIKILIDYQKELLKSQFAIPLFFAKHQMHYKNDLDIGEQPPADAEVELWRVTQK